MTRQSMIRLLETLAVFAIAAGCASTDAAGQLDAAADAVELNEAADENATGASGCESAHGPAMVELSTPGGDWYCIDATEVTESDYQAFLGAFHDEPGGEHARCAGNTTYQPGKAEGTPPTEEACPAGSWNPGSTPDWPVSCVDWCDAYAYCKWAGKRLCGRVGGGEEAPSNRDDPSASQWYNACSQGGQATYSYGDEFDPTACSGAVLQPDSGIPDWDAGIATWSPSDVGTWPRCRGSEPPWTGAYDLSGSVSEWTDSCEYEAGPLGDLWHCAWRGGSFLDNTAERYRCATVSTSDPRFIHPTIGFRCCKDLE